MASVGYFVTVMGRATNTRTKVTMSLDWLCVRCARLDIGFDRLGRRREKEVNPQPQQTPPQGEQETRVTALTD